MNLNLDSPVQYIPRVGPAMAARLEKLNIRTVSDLLWYPPFRYNDFSLSSPISQVHPGDTVTISGEISTFVNLLTKHGKKMQVATLTDNSGKIEIIWFNQPYLQTVIQKGMKLNVAGTVQFFGHKIAIMSPDYEIIGNLTGQVSLHTGRLVPIYPETEGVSSKWLRGRIAFLLDQGFADTEDYLPEITRQKQQLMGLSESLSNLHFPVSTTMAKNARFRLAFDELLLLQLEALEKRKEWETTQTTATIPRSKIALEKFIAQIPFELTNDQIKVIDEIRSDLARSFPMNRLLEGDVGAGKTVVAAAEIFEMYQAGYGSILMAPTQILAEQHFRSISELYKPFNIKVNLITGLTNAQNKSKLNSSDTLFDENKANNHPQVYIGTHALLSASVNFQIIGLVIIDEQQRFGVAQRALLKQKGEHNLTPHLLTMTATPIPRTIALAIWGNLDLSIIEQMPKGRIPSKTWVVPQIKRTGAYEWIRNEIKTKQAQVFIVCPLIDDSESLQSVKSVNTEYERLAKNIYPDLKVRLLHGRLKPKEKAEILESFHQGKFDILVTTPVVEVGIDIPRASIMMIEGSDRFGLSQLHQLRGRVGRRSQQSYCLLFTDSDDPQTLKRLKSLETVHLGPKLAEIDLAFRGPGELFGTKQHGLPNLRFANILDMNLVERTRNSAQEILTIDPQLTTFPLLRKMQEKSKMTIVSQD